MDKDCFDLVLFVLAAVFGIISDLLASGILIGKYDSLTNNCLRKCLTHRVDLGNVTTTGNADAQIDVAKHLSAEEQEWFVGLESEGFAAKEVERTAVDLDETFAGFAMCDRYMYKSVGFARITL